MDRDMSTLAIRLARENPKSIVLHLSEPYNNTAIDPQSHVIPANFTWSLQTINSIKTTNSFASYQIIPVEITLLLASHLKDTMYEWTLLLSLRDFESVFASLLHLAKVTYIEIPSTTLLNIASSFYKHNQDDTPYDSFISVFDGMYIQSCLLML